MAAFNELLEAKLNLLHKLLVPPENIAEVEADWDRLIALAESDKKDGYKSAWDEFTEKSESDSAPNRVHG